MYYTQRVRPRNGHFNPCNTPPILRFNVSLSLTALSLSPFLSVSSFRGSRPQIDMRDRTEENDVRHHITCARETGSRSGRLFVAASTGPLLHRSPNDTPKEHCRTQLCNRNYIRVCAMFNDVVDAIRRRDRRGGGAREMETVGERRRRGGYLLVRAGLSDSSGMVHGRGNFPKRRQFS